MTGIASMGSVPLRLIGMLTFTPAPSPQPWAIDTTPVRRVASATALASMTSWDEMILTGNPVQCREISDRLCPHRRLSEVQARQQRQTVRDFPIAELRLELAGSGGNARRASTRAAPRSTSCSRPPAILAMRNASAGGPMRGMVFPIRSPSMETRPMWKLPAAVGPRFRCELDRRQCHSRSDRAST